MLSWNAHAPLGVLFPLPLPPALSWLVVPGSPDSSSVGSVGSMLDVDGSSSSVARAPVHAASVPSRKNVVKRRRFIGRVPLSDGPPYDTSLPVTHHVVEDF